VTLSGDDRTLLAQFVAEAKAPRIFSVPAALELFGCFAGRTWMHIAPSGDVYPCACLPQAVGNIFKEPIETIWRRMAGLPYQGSKNCPMRQG
jgi:MoaA/NifB/PqqE/SkfB family radical SAM enzyme